nr:ABC transporter ATP-binding protein [Shewanella intestini]
MSHQYKQTTAINNVDLTITAGECIGFLGPNGAGKSTLLEILEGVKTPTSGKVLFQGRQLTKHYKQQIGIQFQSTSLPDFLTVKDTLLLFASFYHTALPIATLIEMCQLSEVENQTHYTLSGGQRQRLLLALSLVNDPEILFLDEPTTGLDPQARAHFWQLVEQIKAQGKTIIITTHYMEEAQKLCDTVVIMDRGKILCRGAAAQLISEHFHQHILSIPMELLSTPMLASINAMANLHVKQSATHCLIEYNHMEDIVAILREVENRGITMRQPHLEDLFMKLTGSELRA